MFCGSATLAQWPRPKEMLNKVTPYFPEVNLRFMTFLYMGGMVPGVLSP